MLNLQWVKQIFIERAIWHDRPIGCDGTVKTDTVKSLDLKLLRFIETLRFASVRWVQ